MERLKLAEDVAAQAYAVATGCRRASTRTARIDLEGFRNVLKLRATHLGTWGGNAARSGEVHRPQLLPEGAGGDVACRVAS